MKIYCCGCKDTVHVRLTDGKEIYPHREDLYSLPFWICDTCGNFVGCHYKTKNRTNPLGCIATPEIKKARMHIHAILDPLWKTGKIKRGKLYEILSDKLGYKYHTANIMDIEEARRIYKCVLDIANGLPVLK